MKYERLTKKKHNKNIVYGIYDMHNDMDCTGDYIYGKAIDRLAELEDKIENGTLVELPCKVGDKVWHIAQSYCGGRELKSWIEEHAIHYIEIYGNDNYNFITDCGETLYCNVFATKEEAEARLKELKEN